MFGFGGICGLCGLFGCVVDVFCDLGFWVMFLGFVFGAGLVCFCLVYVGFVCWGVGGLTMFLFLLG